MPCPDDVRPITNKASLRTHHLPLVTTHYSLIATHFGRNRSAPYTKPRVRNAITTSPTAPTTNGRKPCLPSSRMLVRRPTPAKVRRKAQRERLARLVNWGLLKTWAVAMALISRKPRTNLGNLRQRNAALLVTPSVCSLRAQ